MDYNKINKIDLDGNGNIALQDINGSNITVNYNDTKEFNKLLLYANEQLVKTIQEMLSDFFQTKREKDLKERKYQTPESLKELAQNVLNSGKKRKIEIYSKNLEGYFRLLESFEEQKMLSNDPRTILRAELEITKINSVINGISDEIEKLIN
jgi:hypothetical protein